MEERRICVLGAGIMGLTTTYLLCEDIEHGRLKASGVTVVAEDLGGVTSMMAPGLWFPFLAENCREPRFKKWAISTWDHLVRLLRSEEGGKAGICLSSGYNLFDEPQQDYMKYWRDTFFNFREMGEKELDLFPPYRYGFGFTSLISNPARYIPWLLERVRKKNVKFLRRGVNNIEELAKDFDLIVNCTGVEAAHLGHVADKTVQPGRGQIIKVHAPWLKNFVIAHRGKHFFYAIPCPDFVVLGGTNQLGDWNLKSRELDRKEIWEGCLSLFPHLKDAKIIEDKVGLRPLRESIRLEAEQISTKYGKKLIVHNYGHGGAGITTHWGCGEEVVSLVSDCLRKTSLHAKL